MQDKNNPFAIFQSNLSKALKAKSWTQAQLAEDSGVLQGNISNYLTGRREPKAAQLHMIATSLGVTMEWLLTGEGGSGEAPKPPAVPNRKAILKNLRDAEEALARAKSGLEGK